MPPPETAVEPFTAPGHRGEVARAHRPVELDSAIARLTDPGQATETLHWGRNYLYAVPLDTAAGRLEAVVKQFRNQTRRARLRRRLSGSKAERSWRGALALRAAGLPTPEPLAWIESERPDGPSFFVSRRLEGTFEARYLLRARNAGEEAERFPAVDPEGFLAATGRLVRALHEAGIVHRDLSIGNLLVRPVPGRAEPELFLIDLNRARCGTTPGLLARSRDLYRLRLLRPGDRRRLLAAYWGERGVTPLRRLVYAAGFYGYRFKHWSKDRLRRPLRTGRGLAAARKPHVHIPAAEDGAGVRDRVVWDPLSDQPHQHAGRLARAGVRLADARDHARAAAAVARAAPAIRRRYRELSQGLYREPTPFDGIGVAVRPGAEGPAATVAALAELGVRRVLLRLHPWQSEHAAEEELARRLAAAGYELAFTLPQSRDLVRDPARWRAAVEELAERFRPFGRHFQVGQAVNRSKWGVWRYSEYLDLAAAACEILRRHAGTEVLGPAVIDFEFHATTALLNLPRPGLRFDAVASLLYVDRRGAPETPQLGFDTAGKVVLLRAIAETSASAAGRSWITEVNWPLWEGPHSPAGRDVAVDEQTQADYLARYYLLALGTGCVERVYWWRLAAKGYGLIDPTDPAGPRRRPAFHALETLAARLEGGRFLGPSPAPPGAWLYRFERDGEETVAGWALAPGTKARLPRAAVEVVDRDGVALGPAGEAVELGPSLRYFRLGGDATVAESDAAATPPS